LNCAAVRGNTEILVFLLKSLDQAPETGTDIDHGGDRSAVTVIDHISALQLLTTKCPTDYLSWRELGDQFLHQMMYQEAGDAYDASIRILLTEAGTDIAACTIPLLECAGCSEGLRGYYYKCATCRLGVSATYCQRCAFDQVKHSWCRGHTPETMLSIPSQRPFSL